MTEQSQSSSSRSRKLKGRRLQRIRRLVRQRQPVCKHCLEQGKYVAWDELDHIKPLERGGTDELDNLQGLCSYHHKEKTAKDRGYKTQGCTVEGIPTDSGHHWHDRIT